MNRAALGDRLVELARELPTRLDAPASFVHSRIIGPEEVAGADDVDEWVALDAAVAARIAAAGAPIVLRVGPGAFQLADAPRLPGLSFEVIVSGRVDALAVVAALDRGAPVRAVLASGETGIDIYRAAAVARHLLGARVPIRVRWDEVLDIKGAALALSFGADELAGPLAAAPQRWKLAQLGGPPEDAHEPSPSHVEALVCAAGRLPSRRR